MIPILLSILSVVLVLVIAISVFLYSRKAKSDTDNKIQTVVKQINDAQAYAHKFDQTQDKNIQNIDENVYTVYKTVNRLQNNIKHIERSTLNKEDISKELTTDQATIGNISANKLSVGDTVTVDNDKENKTSAISLQGSADETAQKSRWRILSNQKGGKDELVIDQRDAKGNLTNYVWMSDGTVGINDNKLRFSNKWTGWTEQATDKAEISNDATDFKQLMIVGNKSSGEGVRKVGIWDRLDVHGDQSVAGTMKAKKVLGSEGLSTGDTWLTSNGSASIGKNLNVQERLFFKDPTLSVTPNKTNNSDPFYLEKVTTKDNSSLRLTLNDDNNKTFEIWGDSCGQGNCNGVGTAQHKFDTSGSAWHKEWVTAKNVQGREHVMTENGASFLKNDGTVKGTEVQARHQVTIGDSAAWLREDGYSKVNKLQLGNKWLLSGTGDGIDNDSWLRLMNKTGSDYYGGFAAGEVWTSKGVLAGSDIRMKNEVCNLPQAEVDKLSLLNPKKYMYKDDPRKRVHFGLIAQEIEKVYPNLVEVGANGLKGIRYNDIIPILIAKIKSMETEIDNLKAH
jgi:uncharacterized protein (UPF0333 family)